MVWREVELLDVGHGGEVEEPGAAGGGGDEGADDDGVGVRGDKVAPPVEHLLQRVDDEQRGRLQQPVCLSSGLPVSRESCQLIQPRHPLSLCAVISSRLDNLRFSVNVILLSETCDFGWNRGSNTMHAVSQNK